MKAFFGAMFGAAMLLAPASGALAAGGYLQASSEEDQIVKEAMATSNVLNSIQNTGVSLKLF